MVAQDVINNFNPEIPFVEEAKLDNLLYLDKTEFLGMHYTFLYEVISGLISQVGLHQIKKQLLLDLATIRIVEPASKLRSIELLETCFGVKHRKPLYTLKHFRRMSCEETAFPKKINAAATDFISPYGYQERLSDSVQYLFRQYI